MSLPTGDSHILEWQESDVHSWLSGLGYPHYENQLKEHRISGDVLCMLDADALKAIGVSTIGQRLSILKAIYQLKVAENIPIEEGQYVPPSEASEHTENVSVDKLHTIVQEQAQRLRSLEEDNRSLHSTVESFMDEINSLRSSMGRISSDESGSSLRRQTSFKWDNNFVKPQKSPTKVEISDSPHPSPHRLEHEISATTRNGNPMIASSSSSSNEKLRTEPEHVESPNPNNSNQLAPKAQRQESSDNLKSFKVSLEDPTWKVLPAALKKYRINNDTWQNYAMFICYGSAGNRIERCLSYDEKPLLLFQRLKDQKKNPVFMLKHIKDIRSPIAVAQQKHAARKASSVITSETAATQGHQKAASTSRPLNRPTRLDVQDLSTAPVSTALSPQPGWPDPGVLSPSAEQQRIEDSSIGPSPSHRLGHTTSSTSMNGSTGVASPSNGVGDSSKPKINVESGDTPMSTNSAGREMPVSSGVSYAVAIYPYMAEHDDEFDVVVGDTFVILSRARGWWVVQRDPTGSGVLDTDIVKQGWVPAGCLLETNVPVASAIAEATAAKGSSTTASSPQTPVSKTPILPLSIISTSFPGIALMDYKKKGEEELDLVKDEALRVFKRYNHWSYAVKEEGGDRGWVPSWFIGKVSATPVTPNPGVPYNPLANTSALEDVNQAQVSPMSSAFPPVQSRTPVM